jgi:uncharacterized protein YfaS (alpha-2-macroglobulin family)
LNGELTGTLVESVKKDIRTFKRSEDGLATIFLAGSYALMMQEKEADALFRQIKKRVKKDDNWYYVDKLAFNSMWLAMVSRHMPSRLGDMKDAMFLDMARELEGQNYSSLSANWRLWVLMPS